MKQLHLLLTSFILLLSITSCGGGSSSDEEYLSGILVSCKHVDSTDDTEIVGVKAGTTGSININCSEEDNPFSLKTSVPNLNITQVTRKVTINAKCNGGNTATMTGTLDFKTGEFGITGTTAAGASLNCKITFNPAGLPTTISTPETITQLLADYGDDLTNSKSNTCPANTLVTEDYQNECNTIDGDIDIHYELTDDQNNKHEIIYNINIKSL